MADEYTAIAGVVNYLGLGQKKVWMVIKPAKERKKEELGIDFVWGVRLFKTCQSNFLTSPYISYFVHPVIFFVGGGRNRQQSLGWG